MLSAGSRRVNPQKELCQDERIDLGYIFVTMERPDHVEPGFQQCLGWLAIGTLYILFQITNSESCQCSHHQHFPHHLTTWTLLIAKSTGILIMAETILGPTKQSKAMRRHCTILSLMVRHLSALFLFIFKRVLSTTRHALWFSWKLPTTSHSSSALYHAWGRWCRT